MSTQDGHLKRWMEDATNDVARTGLDPNNVSESELGDLQAMRELAALESAARAALEILHDGVQNHAAISQCISKLRSALKAL